ncbi:hypothetical protein GTO89_11420 [Heliobacterium gestii]|uniref:Uncharacterized protein n=1 Tax=Heliomicrobium gestii TaxID=2699 RepID=A0A845LDM2_HELGE|nr:CC/Se motif family (seleno)protein [Heliomicrobium gestii]MBM7867385.1 hypothetical protein [Heliomicrobium gestii]MZP43651.1 hypothetical protein [Heliomicrobium gestii]
MHHHRFFQDWTITPAAQAFIEQKGGAIHIPMNLSVGCCIHLDAPPEIEVGPPRPQDPAAYERFEKDGVTIYQDKRFDCGHPLTIDLSRGLLRAKLAVKGWRLA